MSKKLLELEDKIKSWISQHRFRIYLFFILGPIILILPSVPYLNLFIEYELSIYIVFIFGLLVLDLSFRQIFILISLLLLVALFFFILDEPEDAEKLGNYIYGILLIWIVREILKIRSEK